MLSTADAKRFIFRSKGPVLREDVKRVVSTIQRSGKKIIDRTLLKPEALIVKPGYPVGELLPSGRLRLVEIQEIDCVLKAAKTKAEFLDLLKRSQSIFVQFGSVGLRATLRRKSDKMEFAVGFSLQNDSVVLHARACTKMSLIRQDRSAGKDDVKFIVSLLDLPVGVKDVAGSYVLEAKSGASIQMRDLYSKDSNPLALDFTPLPNALPKTIADVGSALERPEISVTEVSWHLGCQSPVPPQMQDCARILKQFNAAKIPVRQIEMMTFWTVRSFEDFADMEIVAAKDRRDVSLSLLQFEFEPGREVQFDLSASSTTKYRLWFSFDDAADASKLAQLLDLKLEAFRS